MKNGTVTAGNASQQNDAAAACLVVAEDKLKELKLEPMGYLVGWAAAGCHPATMGIGPVPAVKKLFAKTGLGFDQMDLVELNEAFACQVLSVLKGWGWNDPDRLNVNGSGISLGHPVAATGVRILTTMLNELRRRKAKYGLETMCVGSGQGLAAIFERALVMNFSDKMKEAAMSAKRYVYSFEKGDGKNKMLLGGKGANLCEMTQIGLNVPPGFTITTDACLAYLAENRLPDGLMDEVRSHIAEARTQDRQDFRRRGQSAAGFGALGLGHVHAGHDGHHPQPWSQRQDARRD